MGSTILSRSRPERPPRRFGHLCGLAAPGPRRSPGRLLGVPSTFLTPATAAVGVTLINIAGSTGGLDPT